MASDAVEATGWNATPGATRERSGSEMSTRERSGSGVFQLETDAPLKRRSAVRLLVLGLGFMINIVSYSDRSNLSLAVLHMETELD